MRHSFNRWRRDFLRRSCQGASAAILGGLGLPLRRVLAQAAPLVDAGFHVHPHYRGEAEFDSISRKVDAALDDFVTEKYHDQIAAVLTKWRTNLLESPTNLQAIESILAPDFRGASPQPTESRMARAGAALEVRRVTFPLQPNLASDAFIQQLRSSLSSLSAIYTAEFQVTEIEMQPNGRLRTRVRYELVGSGPGFHR